MTNTTHPLRHAGSALAVVLAFASTQSLAQDAAAPIPAAPEPVVVAPDIPAPAAPEPVMVQEPTVQPVPEPAPEASTPPPADVRAAATPSRTATSAPNAGRPAPTPAPRTVAAPEPADTTVIPSAPAAAIVAPVAAPVVSEQPRATTTQPTDTGLLALAFGGLVFLALAIWGFMAIGRRKPVRGYVAERTSVKPEPKQPVPSVYEPAAAEPAVVPAQPTRSVEPMFAARHPAGSLPHSGAAVALPRELPESFEAREELFRRMVDARPDRANPFTDRKARMKRARLIMQSIGRDFGDADPWIDLSQYPNNWPELANRRSAAA